MIARESFEKSLPRLASAAPFLCLIEDHLLCPDTHVLLDPFEEQFVHARIFGQLRVERSRFEARDLPTVGIPIDLEIHQTQVVAVEHDHPGAGAEQRAGEGANGLIEAVEPHQAHEGRGLTARHDKAVEAGQLLRLAHLADFRAQTAQHRCVLAKVALDGQHTDAWAHYQPRVSSSSSGASVAAESPLIASPSPRETRARISASR